MNKGRRKATLIGLVLATVGLVAWIVSRPSEPRYDNLSLTQLTWYLSVGNAPNRPTWEELQYAEYGIWSIGTNGIPFLISNIRNRPAPWVNQLRNRLAKSPFSRFTSLLPVDSSSEAAQAFRVLGPLAKPWLGELASMVTNSSPDAATDALWAISNIRDEEACSVLIRAMASTNLEIRGWAVAALGDMGWRGRAAVPQLVEILQSTNNRVPFMAAWSLASISTSPEVTMPALIERLKVCQSSEAVPVMNAFASYGRLAIEVLPLVRERAASSNEWVALAAKEALSKIQCEVRDGAIIRGPIQKRKIALTFTAHEFGEGGVTILDELARQQSKASFFLTGDFLSSPGFASLADRLKREGHLLGPHSDRHLLYCSWDSARTTLITRHEFRQDFFNNVLKIAPAELRESVFGGGPRRGTSYLLPPFEHYNRDIADWTRELGRTLINFTPGTRSNADYTGEADTNFVSSQAIFDSILKREREDPHGLNGFILLLHLGSGPGRKDKFHTRFGELLDVLAAKGYQFVRVDELLEPKPEDAKPTAE